MYVANNILIKTLNRYTKREIYIYTYNSRFGQSDCLQYKTKLIKEKMS